MDPRRASSMTLALACAVALAACGSDGDGSDPTPTPDAGATAAAGRTAERPAWFPARFTLPPDTTVVSEQAEGTGGVASFQTRTPFARVVRMYDLNWGRNGYTQLDRQASEQEATYAFEDSDHSGTVTLTPSGGGTAIDVELTPK